MNDNFEYHSFIIIIFENYLKRFCSTHQNLQSNITEDIALLSRYFSYVSELGITSRYE